MDKYPHPSVPGITQVMRGNRRKNTKPEVLLRQELHRRGLRFRVDHPIDHADGRVRPDVVFTRWRLAVFVDGCFWHRCTLHGTTPQGPNATYWRGKLDRNVARDRRNDVGLTEAGWHVLRLWEHDAVMSAAALVEETIARLSDPSVAKATPRHITCDPCASYQDS